MNIRSRSPAQLGGHLCTLLESAIDKLPKAGACSQKALAEIMRHLRLGGAAVSSYRGEHRGTESRGEDIKRHHGVIKRHRVPLSALERSRAPSSAFDLPSKFHSKGRLHLCPLLGRVRVEVLMEGR